MFRCGFQFLSVSFCSCLLVLSLRSLRSLRSLARCACPTVMWFLGACRWCFPVCLCYRCTCQTVTWFLGAFFLTPNPSKILPKSFQNPPPKILPKNIQHPSQKPPKSTPKGASFRDHLERRFGTDFCPNCAASWGVLEAVLGASWGVLGASWGVLGVFWGVLGASWKHLGPSRVRLGRSWARLGCLLARLGRIFAFRIDFSMIFP